MDTTARQCFNIGPYNEIQPNYSHDLWLQIALADFYCRSGCLLFNKPTMIFKTVSQNFN